MSDCIILLHSHDVLLVSVRVSDGTVFERNVICGLDVTQDSTHYT